MEEIKQQEKIEEKTILDAQRLDAAVSMFFKETKNFPEFTVDIEEVKRIVSAFKGVDSRSAIMSMSIIAPVLKGHEIMLLISMFKKALSFAAIAELFKEKNS